MTRTFADLPLTSVVLSRDEVLAILHLMGIATIPGLNDEPIPHVTPEQRAFGLIVAERALRARGLAVINEEGRLLIQGPVLGLIGACAFPSQSLYVTRVAAPSGMPAQLIAHHREGAWMLHGQPETVIHAFQGPLDWSAVKDEIKSFGGWPDRVAEAPGTLTVANQTLASARELAAQGRADEARSALLAADNAPEAVEYLLDILAHPHTVVVVQHVRPVSPDSIALQSVTILYRDDKLLVAMESAEGDGQTGAITSVQPTSPDAIGRILDDLT